MFQNLKSMRVECDSTADDNIIDVLKHYVKIFSLFKFWGTKHIFIKVTLTFYWCLYHKKFLSEAEAITYQIEKLMSEKVKFIVLT